MINPFLVGERVYLRAFEIEDAAGMVPWFNDPEVRRHVLRQSPLNRLAEEAFLRRATEADPEVILGIVLVEGDRLIGSCSLFQFDQQARSAALGILLGEKDTWGRGYGTEAVRLLLGHGFDTLNLHRVWLEVFDFNARAVRAYEKCGFVLEGRLRQDTFRGGRYWDTLVMGLLAPEWRARTPSARNGLAAPGPATGDFEVTD